METFFGFLKMTYDEIGKSGSDIESGIESMGTSEWESELKVNYSTFKLWWLFGKLEFAIFVFSYFNRYSNDLFAFLLFVGIIVYFIIVTWCDINKYFEIKNIKKGVKKIIYVLWRIFYNFVNCYGVFHITSMLCLLIEQFLVKYKIGSGELIMRFGKENITGKDIWNGSGTAFGTFFVILYIINFFVILEICKWSKKKGTYLSR